MRTSIADYENRILDILNDDDLTVHFDEMLAIGAEVTGENLTDMDRQELAGRICRGMWFWGYEDENRSLCHVAWLHLLMRLQPTPARFAELIHYIGEMRVEPRYRFFLLSQARHMADLNPQIATTQSRAEFMAIYRHVVNRFAQQTGVDLSRLKRTERLPHQTVILTQQYLNNTHPPTRACDETARLILRHLGQDVMIMNTNDLLPVSHVVPLFGIEGHNSMECLQESNYTFVDGVSVPYFQPENRMPDPAVMKVILETIRELKPQYVVSIGAFSPVASLAARMLPVVSMRDLRPEGGSDVMLQNLTAIRQMIAEGRYWKVVVRGM